MSGSPPCSRHGHVSVAIGTDIYIHGGMAGTDMFDDLYKFDTGMQLQCCSNTCCVMHQSIPAAPIPPLPRATAGHLHTLSVPGVGH